MPATPVAPANSIAQPIPSRRVLDEAVAENQRLGHENLGFLSESHGFLPVEPPLLELPPSHRPWDDMVPRMPELHRTLQLRHAFDAMPLLSAAEAALPERYLYRASALLSFFAHAYTRVRNAPPEALPDCIELPWQEVSRRLGRPAPFMSYIDLIIYNWRLRDPARVDALRVDNLDLLIASVGNREEQVFHLAQLELAAQGTPLVGLTVRAQEATTRGDVAGLKRELLGILVCLRELTDVSYMKVDPNPYSETFVDQAVWAKTVAPFALPIREGVQGNAGSASPIFPLMDEFLSRTQYDSTLGQEFAHLRQWFPQHWQEFFSAIGQVSVRAFVEQRGDRGLQGLFQSVLDAYAGENGFLGVHRRKAYGFLRIAFKAGRTVTIGAFGDRFKEQAWDRINAELDATRLERYSGVALFRPSGMPRARGNGEADVTLLGLDVAGAGVYYRPGDRCGVYVENSDLLVDRTLRALRASGDEVIRLNRAWLDGLRVRYAREPAPTLRLADLLRQGRIRPVSREVAKSLAVLTASSKLREIIEARAEDQWELWDLLDLLYESGFETRRLWKAEPWEAESICALVPPEPFRLYSISSAMGPEPDDGAQTVDLTVARLDYRTHDTAVSQAGTRAGTASSYVRRVAGRRPDTDVLSAVPLQIVPAPRFHLPPDPQTPIVMFAAGAGIAPFRGFLQERLRQDGGGENWLFLGARTPEQLYYREDLEEWIGAGRLRLQVAFSASDTSARSVSAPTGGMLAVEPGVRRRLDALIEEQEIAQALWDLVRPRDMGGRGAHIYVCGRTAFAATIERSLRAILERCIDVPDEDERAAQAQTLFYRLVATGRYKQDVFTTYMAEPAEGRRKINISDVVLHNNDRNGHWLIISGTVYDMSDFMHLHPGGHRLIIENAGTDATHAYRAVQHHLHSEVDALLGMYDIGAVRRLQFGSVWGVALGPTGLRYVALADLFRAWARFTYLVVDMENALRNDFSTLRQAATAGESADEMTPMKAQMIVDTHRRFMLNQFATVVGEGLDELWSLTVGLCAPHQDARLLRRELDAALAAADTLLVKSLADVMDGLVDELIDTGREETWESLRQLGNLIYRADRRFLASIKLALCEGLQVFEMCEERTLTEGSERLIDSLMRAPAMVADFSTRLANGARAICGERLSDSTPASLPGDFSGEAHSSRAALLGHGGVVDAAALTESGGGPIRINW